MPASNSDPRAGLRFEDGSERRTAAIGAERMTLVVKFRPLKKAHTATSF